MSMQEILAQMRLEELVDGRDRVRLAVELQEHSPIMDVFVASNRALLAEYEQAIKRRREAWRLSEFLSGDET